MPRLDQLSKGSLTFLSGCPHSDCWVSNGSCHKGGQIIETIGPPDYALCIISKVGSMWEIFVLNHILAFVEIVARAMVVLDSARVCDSLFSRSTEEE